MDVLGDEQPTVAKRFDFLGVGDPGVTIGSSEPFTRSCRNSVVVRSALSVEPVGKVRV